MLAAANLILYLSKQEQQQCKAPCDVPAIKKFLVEWVTCLVRVKADQVAADSADSEGAGAEDICAALGVLGLLEDAGVHMMTQQARAAMHLPELLARQSWQVPFTGSSHDGASVAKLCVIVLVCAAKRGDACRVIDECGPCLADTLQVCVGGNVWKLLLLWLAACHGPVQPWTG